MKNEQAARSTIKMGKLNAMRKGTISEYEETDACRLSVTKAIQHAIYEYCEETKSWCGYIRELPGCWAQGDTIEETRLQLIDVIEGWLILSLQSDDAIPQLDGLTVGKRLRKRVANATQDRILGYEKSNKVKLEHKC